MKRKTAWVVGGLIALAALVLGIWNFYVKPEDPMQVKTVVVKPASLQEAVHTSGTVKPEKIQEIRTLSPARVIKVAYKTGDSVQAGTTVIELDASLVNTQIVQAQAALEAAKANRNLAQSNLEALKKAGEGPGNFQAAQALTPRTVQGFNPTDLSKETNSLKQAELSVAQADAAVKQAQAGLSAAQVQRAQLSLKSTLSGTVLDLNAQEGNIAPVQIPLAVIADLTHLFIELNLNEVDAARVKSGQQAEISGRLLANKPLKGTVGEIAPQAVVAPGLQTNPAPTVKVKVVPEQPSSILKPGFSVDVDILVAARENVLVIPQEALFQEENKSFVYRLEAGKVHKTEVSLGIANEANQEILTGLNSGDQVVLNPTDRFYEGMPVKIQDGSEGG